MVIYMFLALLCMNAITVVLCFDGSKAENANKIICAALLGIAVLVFFVLALYSAAELSSILNSFRRY